MFRGFIIESKEYMDYPACGRWYFWSRFPIALVKYYFFGLCDIIRLKIIFSKTFKRNKNG